VDVDVESSGPGELAKAPRRHRFQSDLEWLKQAVSYASAIGTVFQAALHFEDTLRLVLDHKIAAVACLVGLAILFSSTLLNNVRLNFPQLRWRLWSNKQKPLPETLSLPRRTARRSRLLLAVGSIVIVLALGLVTSLLVLSFTGIHYVIFESAANYELAVQEAARINKILERSGDTSLKAARPSHARPANPSCAILFGPYFSKSAADAARKRLLSIPEFKEQKPKVVDYTIHNLGTITSRR
jgi:hypothetical protein